MHLDWLLNPITFYSLASVCLLTSLTLFVSIKLEMAKARDAAAETEALRATDLLQVRDLEAEFEKLRESVRRLEAVPPTRVVPPGINLTKRAQALRMHHRGESIPSIAAAMESPVNEIALLLKVQALTNDLQKAS